MCQMNTQILKSSENEDIIQVLGLLNITFNM